MSYELQGMGEVSGPFDSVANFASSQARNLNQIATDVSSTIPGSASFSVGVSTGSGGGGSGGAPAQTMNGPAVSFLPPFGPGQYPGTDDISSESRIYGTIHGAVPRNYKSAQEVIDMIHCVNMQIPQGLPAQTKAQRDAFLAQPRMKCLWELAAARGLTPEQAAPVATNISGIKITPGMLRIAASTPKKTLNLSQIRLGPLPVAASSNRIDGAGTVAAVGGIGIGVTVLLAVAVIGGGIYFATKK